MQVTSFLSPLSSSANGRKLPSLPPSWWGLIREAMAGRRKACCTGTPHNPGHVGDSGFGVRCSDTAKVSVNKRVVTDKMPQIWNLSCTIDQNLMSLKTLRHRD